LIILLGIVALFFANPLWVGILIALGAYFLELVVDNICARMTWQWMLKATYLVGTGSAGINIIWLYLKA
jgi:ech hydrogenase subunit B